MKTQIIITAKKEGLFSKAHGSVWGTFGMFGKRSVTVEIDGNLYDVPANNQPTAFDVEPGEHTLVFTDPRFNIKNKTRTPKRAKTTLQSLITKDILIERKK